MCNQSNRALHRLISAAAQLADKGKLFKQSRAERTCATGFGAKITQEICPEKFASISSRFRTVGHS